MIDDDDEGQMMLNPLMIASLILIFVGVYFIAILGNLGDGLIIAGVGVLIGGFGGVGGVGYGSFSIVGPVGFVLIIVGALVKLWGL